MRYAREFTALVVVAALVLSLLVVLGYRPRPEAPGDDTPLEHEIGADPPPELREP